MLSQEFSLSVPVGSPLPGVDGATVGLVGEGLSCGPVFKGCGCRDADGRRWDSRCPRLRGVDGGWSEDHGSWRYRLELPRAEDGRRRQWRRIMCGAADSRQTASDERAYAIKLLDSAGVDVVLRQRIGDVLWSAPLGEPLAAVAARMFELPDGVRPGGPLTVAVYLRSWLAGRVMDDNTRSGYEGHVRNYLVPFLGHLPVRALTAAVIEGMFAKILARDNVVRVAQAGGGPLIQTGVKVRNLVGLATLARVNATLRKALNDAIGKYRLLDHNPASFVQLPTPPLPKARIWTPQRVESWQATGMVDSPVMVWTPQQAGEFLDFAELHDPDLYPMFRLILLAGPRRGEAVGIRADQLDLRQGVAVFTYQLTTVKSRPVYKPVKTRNGDRIVALDSGTIDDLAVYARRRQARADELGDLWPSRVRLATPLPGGGRTYTEVDVFFRRPDGQAWHPDAVSGRFRKLVKAAGLPPVRVHDGRHGAATYTGAAGGSLLGIKHRLGLSTIAIAGDIYTSILQEVERGIAEDAAALLPRQRTRSATPPAPAPPSRS